MRKWHFTALQGANCQPRTQGSLGSRGEPWVRGWQIARFLDPPSINAPLSGKTEPPLTDLVRLAALVDSPALINPLSCNAPQHTLLYLLYLLCLMPNDFTSQWESAGPQ